MNGLPARRKGVLKAHVFLIIVSLFSMFLLLTIIDSSASSCLEILPIFKAFDEYFSIRRSDLE